MEKIIKKFWYDEKIINIKFRMRHQNFGLIFLRFDLIKLINLP